MGGGVTKIFTDSLLRESHVAQAGLQLDTAKDGLALLLFLPVSQARVWQLCASQSGFCGAGMELRVYAAG